MTASETPISQQPGYLDIDPTPFIERMGEITHLGKSEDLFRAMADYQSTALHIALHAPFLPFHVYAEATRRSSPLVAIATSLESAVTHAADAMNQNTEELREEIAQADAATTPANRAGKPMDAQPKAMPKAS
jgi:hypothetical protein